VKAALRPRTAPVPLWFKSKDRSDVKPSSTFRGDVGFESNTGVHQSIQEEVSMSSSSLIQGLLIAENAG
jgi:hypothetical protein